MLRSSQIPFFVFVTKLRTVLSAPYFACAHAPAWEQKRDCLLYFQISYFSSVTDYFMSNFTIAALYKFVELPDYEAMREPLQAFCEQHDVKGTLLLALEGINGTIAGPREGIDAVLAYLRNDPRLATLEHKESWSEDREPFHRMRVRLKKEIVTMGQPNVNGQNAGTYVKPEDWNALISDPDVVLIDTRNDYEVDIGTFKGAVNPETVTFREFPQWVQEQAQEGGLLDKNRKKKVAMFCTGGIRCEKSTAYMKSQGYDEVYHLEGGILKYLETIPQPQSLWEGECFVFDERVSVGHGLVPGPYIQCRACRHPLSDEDRASAHYVRGESCPHCWDKITEEQRERFRERQRQVDLAEQRHEGHIGAKMDEQIRKRREEKRAQKEKSRQLAHELDQQKSK